MFKYYFLPRVELGAAGARLRAFACDHQQWNLVYGEMLEQQLVSESGGAAVRVQVVANWKLQHERSQLQFAADDSQAQQQARLAEWRRRAQCLPFVDRHTALHDGDVLLLHRVPRGSRAAALIYGQRTAQTTAQDEEDNASSLNAAVPPDLNHLLRRLVDEPQLLHASAAALHASGARGYQPQAIAFDASMSEADRIRAVASGGGSGGGSSGGGAQWTVPAALRYSARAPLHQSGAPPEHYVCKRCGVAGHWLRECPTRGDARFDPARVVSCNGMSKSLLKRIDAVPDDADAVIYKDQEGRLYVKRDNVRDRAKQSGEAMFELMMMGGK